MISPVRYTSTVETIAPDEGATIAELSKALSDIANTTYEDSGRGLRGVHAKAHGLLKAELEVLPGLTPNVAQGMFAQPGRYTTFMRFSTLPGDILDDSVSLPRGLALKVVGVAGPRLPGSEGATTQDFVLVNAPAFAAPEMKSFLRTLKLLAKTTDTAEGAKKLLSAALRGGESIVEAFGGQSPLLKTLGGQPATHILGETFYSQVPIRFGDYIAKIAAVPISPELAALKDKPIELSGHPNALRDVVQSFFRDYEGVWELRAQLCTNLETMPIEDATKVWSESDSSYVPVARLTAGRQDAWSSENIAQIDEGMAFGPWNGVMEHQPLGSIMRARKETYKMSAESRGQRNGCPIHEPRQG